MFSLTSSTLLALFLTLRSTLAQYNGPDYTVWSSVVFIRTGERTPVQLSNNAPTLTPLGAQQAYSVGAFMRARYFGTVSDTGTATAPLMGLSLNDINPDQVYIGAMDAQYTAASAQAFMQAFYPPTNATTSLANGTQVEGPLNGYQYPIVHVPASSDPGSVFLAGWENCPAFNNAVSDYENSAAAREMAEKTGAIYQAIGDALLEGSALPPWDWNSYWAWPIWDYLNYQNNYNDNVTAILAEERFFDNETGTSYLDVMKWLADEQINAWYGNLDAYNNVTQTTLSSAPTGSISTLAGNYLASVILGQLQQAVAYQGEWYKLNLLFGDFQPLTAFFNLAQLPAKNPQFLGMPEYASSAVFELYSNTDASGTPTFPTDEADLWVRFSFRNGTDGDLIGYSLFDLDPDAFEYSWADFSSMMYTLYPGDEGAWCQQCGADSIFCPYFNASDSASASSLTTAGAGTLSPLLAGVIGALVTLAVAALLFAALMLCAGLRFHRVYRAKKSEVGGYKGSQKLASDRDLVIPKGGDGAAVVETVEDVSARGAAAHERVGSWELKQNAPQGLHGVPHYDGPEEDGIGEAPWLKATLPDERV